MTHILHRAKIHLQPAIVPPMWAHANKHLVFIYIAGCVRVSQLIQLLTVYDRLTHRCPCLCSHSSGVLHLLNMQSTIEIVGFDLAAPTCGLACDTFGHRPESFMCFARPKCALSVITSSYHLQAPSMESGTCLTALYARNQSHYHGSPR